MRIYPPDGSFARSTTGALGLRVDALAFKRYTDEVEASNLSREITVTVAL